MAHRSVPVPLASAGGGVATIWTVVYLEARWSWGAIRELGNETVGHRTEGWGCKIPTEERESNLRGPGEKNHVMPSKAFLDDPKGSGLRQLKIVLSLSPPAPHSSLAGGSGGRNERPRTGSQLQAEGTPPPPREGWDTLGGGEDRRLRGRCALGVGIRRAGGSPGPRERSQNAPDCLGNNGTGRKAEWSLRNLRKDREKCRSGKLLGEKI